VDKEEILEKAMEDILYQYYERRNYGDYHSMSIEQMMFCRLPSGIARKQGSGAISKILFYSQVGEAIENLTENERAFIAFSYDTKKGKSIMCTDDALMAEQKINEICKACGIRRRPYERGPYEKFKRKILWRLIQFLALKHVHIC